MLIVTERLTLRPLKPTDVDELLVYHGDEETVRYIPWPVRTRNEVATWLKKVITLDHLSSEGDSLILAITLGEEGPVIGQLNATFESARNETASIGWLVGPSHQRRGYATEAVTAFIETLFATGRFRRLTAVIDSRNARSIVLAERLGLRREATFIEDQYFKEVWISTLVYAARKAAWTPSLSN